MSSHRYNNIEMHKEAGPRFDYSAMLLTYFADDPTMPTGKGSGWVEFKGSVPLDMTADAVDKTDANTERNKGNGKHSFLSEVFG